MRPNESFETDTQLQGAAWPTITFGLRGALQLCAAQLRR